jgi:hypothetical protein
VGLFETHCTQPSYEFDVTCIAIPQLLSRKETKFLQFFLTGSRCSSVSIETSLRAGRPGFDSRKGRGFLSPRHPVQTGPSQSVSGVLSPGVNRTEREADQTLPSSTMMLYLHSSNILHGVVLSSAQGKIYLLPLPFCDRFLFLMPKKCPILLVGRREGCILNKIVKLFAFLRECCTCNFGGSDNDVV